MPPRKRSGSKRYKSRTYKKRAPTNKTLNKRIKNIENNLIEMKAHDSAFGPLSFQHDGVIIANQNYIPSNISATGRIGNDINVSSMSCNLVVYASSAQFNHSQARCIVFWDRQANGDAPPLWVKYGDVFRDGLLDNSVTLSNDLWINAPYNIETHDRYTVLYDKTYNMVPTVAQSVTYSGGPLPSDPEYGVATAFGAPAVVYRKHFKLSRKIKYSNTDAGPDAIVSNAIYVAWITNSDAYPCTVRGTIRLNYRDA